jgi:hypothetical protein
MEKLGEMLKGPERSDCDKQRNWDLSLCGVFIFSCPRRIHKTGKHNSGTEQKDQLNSARPDGMSQLYFYLLRLDPAILFRSGNMQQ